MESSSNGFWHSINVKHFFPYILSVLGRDTANIPPAFVRTNSWIPSAVFLGEAIAWELGSIDGRGATTGFPVCQQEPQYCPHRFLKGKQRDRPH